MFTAEPADYTPEPYWLNGITNRWWGRKARGRRGARVCGVETVRLEQVGRESFSAVLRGRCRQ